MLDSFSLRVRILKVEQHLLWAFPKSYRVPWIPVVVGFVGVEVRVEAWRRCSTMLNQFFFTIPTMSLCNLRAVCKVPCELPQHNSAVARQDKF